MKLIRTLRRSLLRSSGLTLLEMMVAVTLLAMIMVGLLAMFNQTQKALHAVNAQSDVFENARGAIQMLSRDLTDMTAFGETNVVNVAFGPSGFSGNINVSLPGSGSASMRFHDAYWLTRANDDWVGIGYFVESPALGVGSLYRFSVRGRENRVPAFFDAFGETGPSGSIEKNVHRVSDGIVNLQFSAVYPYVETVGGVEVTNFISQTSLTFTNNALPAYVDVELGVLEPSTLKQMQSLLNDPGVSQATVNDFLTNQIGKVHYFRQRVPIRNFLNPYRSNEVP